MAKKKRIKLNDQQLMLMADNVSDIYRQLCNDLFDNVVERLHDRGTYYLDQQPYLWQLEKMADVGMLNDHNIKLIAEYSGIAEKQIRYIIENEGYQVYKDTHAQLNSNAYDYKVMKDLISYSNQAVNDVHNLINTTLPKSVQATYKDIIETTVAKVITGMATPQKALDETIMKFQERGFYGYTDRAGRRQRADAYARTVIKTTARRTFNEMRMRPAQELGIDTFYYSIKAAAREMCAPLQNQIVTTGQARTEEGIKIFALDDYGYGKPGGCQGINCGHTMTPFIPGVNYMPDIDDDLKGLTPEQAIENANAQSKQRAIERSIRQSKEMLHVAEKLGDQELIDKYKSKVRIQQGAMRDYLKQHPFLHRDYAREKYYADPYAEAKKETQLRKRMSEHHYIKDGEIPAFKKVGGKITKPERKVLYADENPQSLGYIGTAHSFAINKFLRDKNAMPPEYQKIVNTLDGVVEKNKILKNTKVNRFDDNVYLKSVVEQNQHLLKDYDNFMDMLNSGKAKYSNDGYTSTSYIPQYNYFKNRPVKTIINIPKNHQIYFTDNDDESEIILPRGTKYDIISAKENKGGIVLEMNVRKDE
uniref:Minor capsid protein n=3 Tax=root TaxID=1 RepID=A0A8S5TV29_9CAUD|nr:MAG TPA: minor capsid protein [Siphoviridae sp. ctGJ32]DAO09524.1 MAG TPA: minor capsid protein [Caudoviricetes sp.]